MREDYLTLEDFVAAIVQLAPEYKDSGVDCWRESYIEGLSPEQAVREDRGYA